MIGYHVSAALPAAKASSTEHHHLLCPIYTLSPLPSLFLALLSVSFVPLSLFHHPSTLLPFDIIWCLWIGFKAFRSKVGRLVSILRTFSLIVCVDVFAFDIRVTYDGHVSYTIEKIIFTILNIDSRRH